MKLRIRGNTIRLRLSQGEVEQVGRGDAVSETTQLAGGVTFTYSLRASDERSLRASMSGTHLVIEAPATALATWASDDRVALDCAAAEQSSAILIEKDFACLTPREGGDDDDTFPHPKAGTDRC